MDDVYNQSYEEVYEVINLMPKELSEKIPLKFRQMIENKRSKTYKINLSSIDEIENANLKKETIIILGMIYRDFICSPEEKRILIEEEREIEREEQEKYNPDNIFKNGKAEEIDDTHFKQEVEVLTEVKEKSFFKKMIEKIKRFFSKS